MAAWYTIINALRTYLRAQTAFQTVIVEAGAMDPDAYDLATAYAGGAVFLIRDREGQDNPLALSGPNGQIDFFVECWIRDDGTDPLDGYGDLATLEDNLTDALTAFVRAGVSGLTITDMQIDETIGDADARRPMVGSRKTISITWGQ